jgi:chemotaxis protein CheX
MPFVESTRKVFETMVKVHPRIGKPSLMDGSSASYDVSGVIGFSGQIIGTVVVSFQMSAAQKMVNALAGLELDPTGPDFVDAIGELTNMIAGSAKKDLGRIANIGIPTVVIGKDHKIGRMSDCPCVLIPCQTDVGNFAVEVNIRPK